MKQSSFQNLSMVLLLISVGFTLWAFVGSGDTYNYLEQTFNDGDGDGDGVIALALPILAVTFLITFTGTVIPLALKLVRKIQSPNVKSSKK